MALDEKGIAIAHLAKGDKAGLAIIRKAFVANNPGYDLGYQANTKRLASTTQNLVVFIQNRRRNGYFKYPTIFQIFGGRYYFIKKRRIADHR